MLRSSKRYHNGGGPVKERGAGTRRPVPLLRFFSYIACRSSIEMSKIVPEIETRRARRALSEEPVPEEVLARIMTAATYAPSCFNNQPWRFLVVSRDRELEIVKENLTGGNYWAKKAPVIVAVFTRPELDCRLSDRRDYAFFSTGLAVENLVLQATKEGLIAHPIAGYKPLPLKEAFGVDPEMILLTLVIIGYPGDEAHLNDKHRELEHSTRDRKPEDQVIMYNLWMEVGVEQ
jgi:nitroreductase